MLKTNEFLYKTSPFVYREGMYLRLCNDKSNVTRKEMHSFIGKRYLSDIDMDILNILYTLKVLNRHVLQQYLWNMKSEYEGKDLKNTLKKMVELGILLRYTYEYADEQGDVQSTPYFYSLSYGAYLYMQKFSTRSKGATEDYEELVADTAYKILAVNQFYVFFLKEYEHLIKREIFHHTVTFGDNKRLTIDLSLRLKARNLSSGFLDILVVPVRKEPGWKEQLKDMIAEYIEYMSCDNSLLSSPVLLFLAESDEHIKEVYSTIKDGKIDFKGTLRLYTTDTQVAREPILNYLYDCEESGDNLSLVVKSINIR